MSKQPKPAEPVQFDLFEAIDLRPKAPVLIIPPHRRRRLVESTAFKLLGWSKKKADAHWRDTVNDLRKELRSFGVSDADAAGRLIQFQQAVQATINTIMAPSGQTGKDSA